jgi:hypothetical protein
VRPQAEEAKIVVLSEDDQTRQLLETRISKDDGYQKQQGTARDFEDLEQQLIQDRHVDSMDGAKWHGYGPQLPGARGLRQHLVRTQARDPSDNALM